MVLVFDPPENLNFANYREFASFIERIYVNSFNGGDKKEISGGTANCSAA